MTWIPRHPQERPSRPVEPGRSPRWSRRTAAGRLRHDSLADLSPRPEVLAALLVDHSAGSPKEAGHSLRQILIVDSDDFGRETLGQILETDGYRVRRARTTADGLRQLRQPPPIGLVLLDMPPPCLDGCQFVRIQEREAGLRHIPVIVLSSIDTATLCRPFPAVVAHFEKPVTVGRLLAAIHQHLPLV